MQYDSSKPPMPIAVVNILSGNEQDRKSVRAALQFDTRSTVTVLPSTCISQLRDHNQTIQKVKVSWIDENTGTPQQQMGFWVRLHFPDANFTSEEIAIVTDDTTIGKIGRDLMEALVVKLDGLNKEWHILI